MYIINKEFYVILLTWRNLRVIGLQYANRQHLYSWSLSWKSVTACRRSLLVHCLIHSVGLSCSFRPAALHTCFPLFLSIEAMLDSMRIFILSASVSLSCESCTNTRVATLHGSLAQLLVNQPRRQWWRWFLKTMSAFTPGAHVSVLTTTMLASSCWSVLVSAMIR